MFSGNRGEFLFLASLFVFGFLARGAKKRSEERAAQNSIQNNVFYELKGASRELSKWEL